MRGSRRLGLVAVAVVLMLTPVALADLSASTTDGDVVVVINTIPGGSGGGCICPHVFDPVVCGEFPNKKYFSNACVAGCNGYYDCVHVELQIN